MKRWILLILITFIFSKTTWTQNFTQVGFIPTQSPTWSVCFSDTILYLAENHNGFSVIKSVNISNPAFPQLLDSLIISAGVGFIDINEDYLFLPLRDNQFGIKVVDVHDPAQLQVIYYYQGSETAMTFYRNPYLYSADGGGIGIFQINNGTLSPLWHSIGTDGCAVFADSSHILGTFSDGNMKIYRTDNHTLLGELGGFDAGIGLSSFKQTAFLTDNARGLISVDIGNPQTPIPLDTLSGNGAIGTVIQIRNQSLFWADGTNGVRLVDITDPSHLINIEQFSPTGIFALDLQVEDTLIAITSADLMNVGFINGVYLLTHSVLGLSSRFSETPSSFSLLPNFPNPFNSSTRITFTLSRGDYLKLEILDLLGNHITTLVNGWMPAGVHQVIWQADEWPSGVYFYRLQNTEGVKIRKMVLIR